MFFFEKLHNFLLMHIRYYLLRLAMGLLLTGLFQAHAQDPILSQYYTNRMYLNPALTGYEPGTTVSANHRNQWAQVAGRNAKFTTNSITADISASCLQSAFGVYFLDNTEGEGFLKWQHLGLSYAWYTRDSRRMTPSDFKLRLGVKATYNWRSLDWSQLVFSDQLDAIRGAINPTSLPLPSGLQSRTAYADFGGGAAFDWTHGGGNRLSAGVAFHHLVRIDNSLFFLDDTLPTRTTLHATYVINQNFGGGNYYIVPMVKADIQKASAGNYFGTFTFRSIMYGVAFSFQENPGLWGGVWLHSRSGIPDLDDINSLIVALGIEVGDGHQGKFNSAARRLRLGLSYDYDYSGLRSDGGGVIEVSLTYLMSGVELTQCNARRGKPIPCPKF